MRATHLASTVCLTVAITVSACSGGGAPLSPSVVAPLTAPASGARIRVLDEALGALPPVTINIVGSVGATAFDPNPLQAMLGDMLVWTNNDVTTHHIVLDDGTDVGAVVPGESSAPVPLTTESASYYCRLHPSMFGIINRELPPMEDDPYPGYATTGTRKP